MNAWQQKLWILATSLWIAGSDAFLRNDDERGGDDYVVGMARHDITPAAADLLMMGYGSLHQTAQGIHQRLFARALIIGLPLPSSAAKVDGVEEDDDASSIATERDRRLQTDPNKNQIPLDPNATICFVSVDIGMGSDLLNLRVLQRLSDLFQKPFANSTISSPCRIENLSISATHTHSAPGGYFQYFFYQIPSLGYQAAVVEAYAEGIVQALFQAYGNLQENTKLRTAQSWLLDANRNRSPTSYLLNPAAERAEYSEEGDTDKTMLQLSFYASNRLYDPRGFINWFAVHGTSMNSSNRLISGDNKGYASYLAERYWNGNSTSGTFVAAFGATNLGDVSPNTVGPLCIDTGAPCEDASSSACDGNCELCHATGPGATMWESTEIIGRLQYEHSLQQILHPENAQIVRGPIQYRHSFLDMSQLNVTLANGDLVHTCPAALGYSFAAGTTDGPGKYPFVQGTNSSSAFWNMLGGFLSVPSQFQMQCQAPKPILFNIGRASVPYQWSPSVVPISIFRVGQLFILNVPAEFTTMAGRRLRKAVRQMVVDSGMIETPIVTIAGLANSYAGYVTTLEEYGGQRYEAASTLYGPHTLSAYIQEFQRVTRDLLSGNTSATLPGPRDRTGRHFSFPSLLSFWSVDTIGLGQAFGSVVVDAKDAYRTGETVVVSFRSANPRNNVQVDGTFLTIDQLDESDGTWHTRFVDADWCTQFRWKGGWTHERFYWGTSLAEIAWDIPDDTPRGMYRVCHYGSRQTFRGAFESAMLQNSVARFFTTVLGSYIIHLAVHIFDFSYHISGHVRHYCHIPQVTQTSDFYGCSRTFLVH